MKQRDTAGPLSGIAMLTSLFAVMVAVVAVVVVSTTDSGSGAPSTPTAPVEVGLGDFFIDPSPLSVTQGATLAVHNAGHTLHNLAIRDSDGNDTGLTTSDLQANARENLDLSSLAPGTYEAWCTIGGHLEAGMTTTLTITESAEVVVAAGDDHAHGAHGADEDWEALDAAMEETIMAFPAETEGRGNEVLEPTEVLDDGTLVFDLVVEITDWEVEPGKVVKAWSYNGMVPGPWIKVNSGDDLQIRVTNNLPLGTDIHFHGIDVPNDMDGVAPITQTLIPADGGTHTYEFTAQRQAVGMYHAHHHGQLAIPNGLFGAFQIDDLPLPEGRTISGMEIPEGLVVDHELPMVLNDAGVIGMSLNGKGFPATEPLVMQEGEWALVHYFNEGLQVHPMHLHGFRQLVVARDGIPLDEPFWVDTINVAPGERFSILFQADIPGTWVWHCHILTHAERAEGMFGMVTAVVVQPEDGSAA
jgi:manganese oxidase